MTYNKTLMKKKKTQIKVFYDLTILAVNEIKTSQ